MVELSRPQAHYRHIRQADGSYGVEVAIEGSSPNNLARFGWSRSSLKTGDHVLVVIHPLKDGAIGGSLVKISVNGQVVGSPKPA